MGIMYLVLVVHFHDTFPNRDYFVYSLAFLILSFPWRDIIFKVFWFRVSLQCELTICLQSFGKFYSGLVCNRFDRIVSGVVFSLNLIQEALCLQ